MTRSIRQRGIVIDIFLDTEASIEDSLSVMGAVDFLDESLLRWWAFLKPKV